MNTQNFFIALVPPLQIQTAVNEIKAYFMQQYGSRKAFNSPPHITLQAPFKWSTEQDLAELTAGLKDFAAGQERVAISLRNFGAFPPKVIYIDVVKTPELMELYHDLAALMATKYNVADHRYRTFCPHMTVAFRDLTKAAFHQAWPAFQQKQLAFDFVAQHLSLLRHNGQQWQIYQEYPLGKSAAS